MRQKHCGRRLFRNAFLALITSLFLLGTTLAGGYSSVAVLGDSLSDSGNIYLATGMAIPGPPDAYFIGRFSNGYNYADQLAASEGIALVPSLAGGTNFAFGGARTASHPADPRFSVFAQAQALLASGLPLDDSTLVILFAGGNNLRDTIFAAAADPANAQTIIATGIGTAVGDIVSILQQLRAAGADQIFVPNAPNLAQTPEVKDQAPFVPGLSALAEMVSMQFNKALKKALKAFDDDHVVRFDTFKFMGKVIKKPHKYGLTNVTQRCYTGDPEDPVAGGISCSDPDAYLFWDGIHPTTAGHALLAEEMLKKIEDNFSEKREKEKKKKKKED